MEVREIGPGEIQAYIAARLKWGSLFSDPAWAGCFGDNISIFGIFDQNNTITGGFLFLKSTLKGYPYYTNPPFTPSIALFYNNPASNPSNRLSTDKEVLEAVARFLREFKFPVQRFCLPPFIMDMQPFLYHGFKVIPHLTYHIDLLLSFEALQSNLSAKLRNNIKKAKNDGLTIRKLTTYDSCESLVLKTYSRNNLGIEQQNIRNILHKFAVPGNSFAFAAFQDEVMIAVSFFLYDNNTCYYIFGGFHDELKHEGAGAATIWEAIRESKNIGLNTFDFEGSMIPRVERYFRGFGGKIVNYFTINRAPFLLEVLLKMVKREIF